MIDEELEKITNSFKTFDEMYDLIISGDYSFLNRECGTNNYPEIKWMMDYFIEKEECKCLKNIILPKSTENKLKDENKWLKLNTNSLFKLNMVNLSGEVN